MDGSARNVQRRLIRYAVVVPATKESALAGVCRPRDPRRASRSPAGRSRRSADSPPVITNRTSWARKPQRALPLVERQLDRLRELWLVLGHRLPASAARPAWLGRRSLKAAMPSRRSAEKAASRPGLVLDRPGRSASIDVEALPQRALGRAQAHRGLGGDLHGQLRAPRPAPFPPAPTGRPARSGRPRRRRPGGR